MPDPTTPDPRWAPIAARQPVPAHVRHLLDYESGITIASGLLWDSFHLTLEDHRASNYTLTPFDILDRIRTHFKNLRDLHLEPSPPIEPPAPTS